jgi:hypothetical protein
MSRPNPNHSALVAIAQRFTYHDGAAEVAIRCPVDMSRVSDVKPEQTFEITVPKKPNPETFLARINVAGWHLARVVRCTESGVTPPRGYTLSEVEGPPPTPITRSEA